MDTGNIGDNDKIIIDPSINHYIPRSVKIIWINIWKTSNRKFFDETRYKYYHHPMSLKDINNEEISYYRINLDRLIKHFIPTIVKWKIKNSFVGDKLENVFIKMKKKIYHEINKKEIIDHKLGIYKSKNRSKNKNVEKFITKNKYIFTDLLILFIIFILIL